MKANEAPEKIYLSDFTDTTESVFYVKQDNTKKTDFEYTRTDAFIEKAEKYLKNQFIEDVSVLAGGVVNINFSTAIENFLNYMKGE